MPFRCIGAIIFVLQRAGLSQDRLYQRARLRVGECAMIRRLLPPLLLAGLLPVALPFQATAASTEVAVSPQPEASPFDEKATPRRRSTRPSLVHVRLATMPSSSSAPTGAGTAARSPAGSRTPRFKAMLDPGYEIVWIDVGQRDRNIDLARRFGLDGIKGTPTVLIVDGAGKARNLKDAPGWKNARSRSEAAIYSYFETRERRP